MVLGAQLFTVREHCYTLDDLSETLEKIADIGYREVQVSGTCDYSGEWLDEQLRKNGLTCHLTHFNFDRTVAQTDEVIALHKRFGCSYIGLGAMPGWPDGYDSFVANTAFRDALKKITGAGLGYSYHNHDMEYVNKLGDGKSVLHHIAEEFSPDELKFTLDMYWIAAAGASLEDEIGYLSGRIPGVHFKDMLDDGRGGRTMCPCGAGNKFSFEKLIPLFDKAGTKYVYVEQDDCRGEDPFVCLARSYDYLRSLGLE